MISIFNNGSVFYAQGWRQAAKGGLLVLTTNRLGSIAAVALALASLTAPVRATDDKLTFVLAPQATSDYIFRGLSYSNEKPTLQAYGEVGYNIFYAGFWASGNDYIGTLGPWELDGFIGARPVTGGVSWDVAVWWYNFGSRDPALSRSDLDYVEFKLGASISPVTNLTLGLTGYYTPDQDLAMTESTTVEGTMSYVLPQVGVFVPTLSGLLGWTGGNTDGFFLGEKEYAYWNAGVKLGIEKLFMDFRYWDTNIDNDLADTRFVFTVGINLP